MVARHAPCPTGVGARAVFADSRSGSRHVSRRTERVRERVPIPAAGTAATPVTGHGRDAGRSATAGVADVAPYLRWLGVQSAAADHAQERRHAAGRLELVDDQRRYGSHADRARWRAFHTELRR